MAQKFLCVYHDMIPTLEKLQPAEVGRLILAALKYDATGEQPASLPGKEDLIWPMIMAQIDRANASYEAKCETNRQNALKRYDGMRPHTTACDGTQYNKNTIQDEDNTKTKTNTEGVKGKAVAFRPPKLEEVEAYCLERGNGVDPQHFIDYYTSNGWRVGRNPMKDWKAAVRTWEKKDAASRKPEKLTNNIFAEIAMEEGIF